MKSGTRKKQARAAKSPQAPRETPAQAGLAVLIDFMAYHAITVVFGAILAVTILSDAADPKLLFGWIGAVLVANWLSLTVTNRSEEHTSELQSLMRTSYAVFCLTKQIKIRTHPKQ